MKSVLVLAILATTAHAQVFPADTAYRELLCTQLPMRDGYNDQAGAVDERDIVGEVGNAAGAHAADDTYLFLRMRLDEDPRPGGALGAFSWGFLIDTDGVLTNYELLLLADGTGPQTNVVVYRNTTTATANDPTDPAEMMVAMFPASSHTASKVATGSVFGATPDHFLDIAVPWSTLAPLGVDRDSRIFVWAASSTSNNSLNGDFACHDGASGAPLLDRFESDPTVGDPTIDTDGDGFTDAEEVEAGTDPNDPGSLPASRLEGGGGCAAGGGGLGVALALLLLRRRSRRRVRSYHGR